MNRFVQHTIHDQVATLRLNRPELHNAFNEVVIEELTHALVELGRNPDTRVIVLTRVSGMRHTIGKGRWHTLGARFHEPIRPAHYP